MQRLRPTLTVLRVTFVQRWTDDELRDELRRVSSLCTGPVTVQQFNRLSDASPDTVRRRFGGWRQALEAAGLADRYAGRTVSPKMRRLESRRMTNDEILWELRAVARRKGSRIITEADVQTLSATIGTGAPAARFGSFAAAVEAAGLHSRYRKGYADEELTANLRAVAAHLGHTPRMRDVGRPPSTIAASTYYDHYGSWPAALTAAGLIDT